MWNSIVLNLLQYMVYVCDGKFRGRDDRDVAWVWKGRATNDVTWVQKGRDASDVAWVPRGGDTSDVACVKEAVVLVMGPGCQGEAGRKNLGITALDDHQIIENFLILFASDYNILTACKT